MFNCHRLLRLLFLACLLISLFASVTVCAAAEEMKSMYEHADMLVYLLTSLVLALVSLITWVLLKINNNQSELFKLHRGLSENFHQLLGAHNAIHGQYHDERRKEQR